MNKKYIFWIIIALAIAIGVGVYFFNSSKNNSTNLGNSNYDASKAAINTTLSNNTTENNISNNDTQSNTIENVTSDSTTQSNNVENTTSDDNTQTNNIENTTSDNTISNNSSKTDTPKEPEPVVTETEIASYTSKIRTKDSDRQNNITIACSTLNDTIVENGKTFSFSDTLGKATSKKGYEKASVFQDGKEIEALGGGKCQVSSTLYNAVLKVSNIEIVERHSHSGEVYYVPKGKDAAVAYGSYDFKFTNNTGYSLKIKSTNTPNDVTIKILKLE